MHKALKKKERAPFPPCLRALPLIITVLMKVLHVAYNADNFILITPKRQLTQLFKMQFIP